LRRKPLFRYSPFPPFRHRSYPAKTKPAPPLRGKAPYLYPPFPFMRRRVRVRVNPKAPYRYYPAFSPFRHRSSAAETRVNSDPKAPYRYYPAVSPFRHRNPAAEAGAETTPGDS